MGGCGIPARRESMPRPGHRTDSTPATPPTDIRCTCLQVYPLSGTRRLILVQGLRRLSPSHPESLHFEAWTRVPAWVCTNTHCILFLKSNPGSFLSPPII